MRLDLPLINLNHTVFPQLLVGAGFKPAHGLRQKGRFETGPYESHPKLRDYEVCPDSLDGMVALRDAVKRRL